MTVTTSENTPKQVQLLKISFTESRAIIVKDECFEISMGAGERDNCYCAAMHVSILWEELIHSFSLTPDSNPFMRGILLLYPVHR